MNDQREWGVYDNIGVIIGEYKVVASGWRVGSIWYKHQNYWVGCHFEAEFFGYLERSRSDQFIYVKHWSNYFKREILSYRDIFLILNSHPHIIAIESDFKWALIPT